MLFNKQNHAFPAHSFNLSIAKICNFVNLFDHSQIPNSVARKIIHPVLSN